MRSCALRCPSSGRYPHRGVCGPVGASRYLCQGIHRPTVHVCKTNKALIFYSEVINQCLPFLCKHTVKVWIHVMPSNESLCVFSHSKFPEIWYAYINSFIKQEVLSVDYGKTFRALKRATWIVFFSPNKSTKTKIRLCPFKLTFCDCHHNIQADSFCPELEAKRCTAHFFPRLAQREEPSRARRGLRGLVSF